MNVKQFQAKDTIQKKAQIVTEGELNKEVAYYKADMVAGMLLAEGYISEEEHEVIVQKNREKIAPFLSPIMD